jgi:hypothetical protein
VAVTPLPPINISGTCDASGNLLLRSKLVAPASFWMAAYLAVTVTAGNPLYTVRQAPALPILFGSGQQTNMGPIILGPGQIADFVVTGAAAGAILTGQVIGWQSEDPSELAQLIPNTSSLFSSPTAAPSAFNLTQLAGTSLTGWPLPTGIRWLLSVATAAIGTYNYDIPIFSNPTAFSQFNPAAGAFPVTPGLGGLVGGAGRASLIAVVALGGGSITASIQNMETQVAGASPVNLLTSALIAAGGTGNIRVAPGLPAAANLTANDLVCATPRVSVVVSVGVTSFTIVLDLS